MRLRRYRQVFMRYKRIVITLTVTFFFLSVCRFSATAQTTSFTYQGKLTTGGSPASGNYDFEFRLFDLLSGGTQQGSTLTLSNVPVVNGIFTVQLDFVACGGCVPCPTCFNGSNRFLDITVRSTGGGSFTPLTPRQPVTSNPFAIRSLNAGAADNLTVACVNCVTSNQISSVSGSSVTGAIPISSVPAGSNNYIQNSISLQSQGAFYISSGRFGQGVRIEGSGFIVPDTPSLSLSATGSVMVDAPFLPGGRFTILENGNVGIGNGAPSQKLDVAGDARFSGNQTVSGNLGIGAISPGSKLNITGNGIVRARINSDSNGGLSFALVDQPKWSIATVTGGDLQIYNDASQQLAMSVNGSDSSVTVHTSISGNGAVRWQSMTGLTQQAQPNTGYLASSSAEANITLPTTPNIGDIVRVAGVGSGGWRIVSGAGQSMVGLNLTPAGLNWTQRENLRSWRSVASSADGVKLVAVASSSQIYTSTDSGSTWTARETSRSWLSVTSSSNGVKLAAVVDGGQIYTSTDSGVTWTPRDSSRAWRSIASSADGVKLAAVVNPGQIYTSTDSGVTWAPQGPSKAWRSVASSADGVKLVAASYAGGSADFIYNSTNSGATWIQRSEAGFWTCVASSADGVKLVATAEDLGIYTSSDLGLNWTRHESQLLWRSVASSADGTRLVAAANPGKIYTSTDSGLTWIPRENVRNWQSVASSADGTKLAAVDASSFVFISNSSIALQLAGGQMSTIELQYIGGGQFLMLSHEGTFSGQ